MSRESVYLERLRNADEALYLLWKQCELGGELIGKLNEFQGLVHAEIKKASGK